MLITFVLFSFLLYSKTSSTKPNSTPYICIDQFANISTKNLPSCLPGYVLNIANVYFESTHDNSCSGLTRCQIETRQSFTFACNRKRTCQLDMLNINFKINSTCGQTRRFYIQYYCQAIIQEQNDFICDIPTQRRPLLADINLSCQKHFHLFILNAFIGLSLKLNDDLKIKLKCNQHTSTMCQYDQTDHFRFLCANQFKSECKISYNQRAMLNQCFYGQHSNYSFVQYLCIPNDDIEINLPRIDICSSNEQYLSIDRGFIYSPVDSKDMLCEKEFLLPVYSRLRIYLFENWSDFYIEFNYEMQTLNSMMFFDFNLTNQTNNQIKFHWKSFDNNQHYLFYFQIDSKQIETTSSSITKLSNDKKQIMNFKQIIGILFSCLIIFLLFLIIIYLLIRQHTVHFTKHTINNNNHHQQFTEQPYLLASSPAILTTIQQQRIQSTYSPTSSIVMQVNHDDTSDCQSLIKSTDKHIDIDNFYEEIKEQQQQTEFALRINSQEKNAQAIRDHHEVFYYECEK